MFAPLKMFYAEGYIINERFMKILISKHISEPGNPQTENNQNIEYIYIRKV
jgi:hypothetical protein